MGHLAQMAGLAVQNFVSAAVGICRGRGPDPRVRPRRGPTGSATSGSTWCAASSGSCCRSRSSPRCCWSRSASIQNLSAGTDVTTLAGQAPDHHRWAGRLAGGDQGARHQRRRLLQRQLRAPVREPEPVHATCFEIFLLLLIPVALTRTFGTMVGDRRQGIAVLAVMALLWARAGRAVTDARGPPPRHRRSRPPVPSMEGKETRFGEWASALFAVSTTGTSTGAVNSFHSSFTGVGGGVPDPQHGARRGRARRCRLRALRDAGPGDHDGLRRRPDGRPHAGVPGQEDHRPRDQAGLAVHPDDAAGRAGRHRRSPCRSRPARLDAQRRARTVSPRCSTPSCPPATTTAPRSPV